MKRALLLWLSLVTGLQAEIPIDQSHVVLNHNGISCGGCSLEALARYHRYDKLIALASRHKSLTYAGDLERLVRAAGLRLWTTPRPDAHFLWEVTRHQGAVVGLRPPWEGAAGHLVTLVELNGHYARYLDPDDGFLYTVPLASFLRRWDGSHLVPIP